MRIDCGKESERPLSRFPLRGKAGAGGFPPRRRHAARQPKPLARIMLAAPPTRGLPPPCASPAGLQRRCTLRHKPDISLANKTGQLDVLPTRRVALVSANMARENWGDPISALGKRIRFGRDGPWNEVIGVAEDVYADGINLPPPATVYSHIGGRRAVTFAIRSERAGTHAFLREIAAQVHAVNPNLPLAKVRTLNDIYRQSMAQTSFALVLLGTAGAMALTLAIVG